MNRKPFLVGLVVIVAVAVHLANYPHALLPATSEPAFDVRTQAAPTRDTLDRAGSFQYLLGINYPWLNYGHDFGVASWPTGSWSHDGVSQFNSKQQVDEHFAYLRSQGVHVVRWFVLTDGRASPEFNSEGAVTGFDSYFFNDLDTALSLACKHDLRLILVLLDYLWLDDGQIVNGVQLGGHSDIIIDATKRQSFLDNALRPLLERYGNDRRILAWEIINEPEWTMSGIPGAGTVGPTVPIAEMQSFVSDITDYIHQRTVQDVTIGSANGQWLLYWQGLGLDFYQFHHFDHGENYPPFIPISNLNLDRPAVLGEFPTNTTQITTTRYLSAAWDNGYSGALAWSLNGDDQFSKFTSPGSADELSSWSQIHDSEVNLPELCTTYLPTVIR